MEGLSLIIFFCQSDFLLPLKLKVFLKHSQIMLENMNPKKFLNSYFSIKIYSLIVMLIVIKMLCKIISKLVLSYTYYSTL